MPYNYKDLMVALLADRERVLRTEAERFADDLESRARALRKELASGAVNPLARLAHVARYAGNLELAGRCEEAGFLEHNSESFRLASEK